VGTPPPVYGHGLVYDEMRHVIVLYGGRNPAQNDWLQQTWEYDGTTWTNRNVTPPTAAAFVSMVYDAGRARTVLFGGLTSTISMRQETWEWDGTVWTDTTGANPPPPRTRASIAYDAVAGSVVLFGGSATDGGGTPILDDTWLRTGTSWALMPSLPVAPSPRQLSAAAYDPVHGRTLLFGGWEFSTTGQFPNDTWEWENGIWTMRASTAAPSPRGQVGLAFDAARGRFVLFGGWNGSLYGDTWEWDDTNWIPRSPVNKPTPRGGVAMTYDAARGVVVLFGGAEVGTVRRDDTWTWDGTTWSEHTSAQKPLARENAAIAYDPVRERVVLFGGDAATFEPLGDTWEWDGSTWTQMTSAVAPAPRFGHQMVYDAQRRAIIMTGGGFGDVWQWDGVAWTPVVSVDRPSVRNAAAMAYDAVRRRVVVFGGSGLTGDLGDTWELQYEAPLQPIEACALATADDDGDGLAGCSDPDCWGRCAPLCPPGATCPATAPRCGDAACTAVEDPFLCPADCL
jgi:hypothetical protein